MSENRVSKNSVLLPEPTLRRLPWYLAYVTMLNQEGVVNVSSRRLAQDLDVDASQIAKDLSFINIKGKTRIGYDVSELEEALRNFLGFRNRHNAV
ncbi:MAG: redox-sensing transcriptional repressor Rex, partial [Muribaculaceae bacterium]|nr:redox-sensing transcriptional repressor Rex [Muribaculaceae bacterium]